MNGSEGNEFKQLWDYYPNLFDEEKREFDEQEELKELERFKEKRRAFAKVYNRKFERSDS